MPAAASTEKEGSFTNTQRLIQWRDKAVDPENDNRSDLWFIYHLGKRLKELYAESTATKDKPLQALTWDYDNAGHDTESRIQDEPDALLVLKEINGYYTRPQQSTETDTNTVYTLRDGPHVPSFTALKTDGSTACGSWIYSGVYPEPDRNWAASRTPGGYTNLKWGFAWPANRRILYNRASADPQGRPWSSARSTSGGTRIKRSGRVSIFPTFLSIKLLTTCQHLILLAWMRFQAKTHLFSSPMAKVGSSRP